MRSGEVVVSIMQNNIVGGGGAGKAAAMLVVGVEAFLGTWMAWLMGGIIFEGVTVCGSWLCIVAVASEVAALAVHYGCSIGSSSKLPPMRHACSVHDPCPHQWVWPVSEPRCESMPFVMSSHVTHRNKIIIFVIITVLSQ